LIHPDHRRKGIAKLLLERIIKDHSSKNWDYLEAYPDKNAHSCEKNYKGYLSLYERNNFKIIKEYANYYVVRRALGKS